MQTVVAKHRNVNRDISNPILRFKGFTNNWNEINFRDVFSFKATNSLSREALTDEIGQIKNIHYGDIHTKYRSRFYITKEEVPYIKKDIDLSRVTEESFCKVGDIVIADASEDYQDIGKAIEIIETNNQKILAGLHTFLARPKESTFATGFLGYLMRSNTMRLQIMILAQGTKVLGISTRHLDEIIIKVPTLQEQQKIASFLSSIDDWIENLTQQKLALEKYKKGMMQKILSQEIRFKDENGKKFPEWEEKKLKDVLKHFKLGGNYENSETVTDRPLIKMGNIGRGKMIMNKIEYIASNEVVDPDDKVKRDDIFFNTRNTLELVGKVAIWKEELTEAYYNSNLMRMTFDCNYYMNYYFNSNYGLKSLKAIATGTTSVAAIYTRDLLKIKLLLPVLSEQWKIAEFLTSIDELIVIRHLQIERAELWKKGLMQKLFI